MTPSRAYETVVRPFSPAAIAEATELIRLGLPVAVPTETVFGLAADATNAAAVAGIYAAKGRPSFNPLIIHVGGLEAGERLAMFDEPARKLAAAFWPGPLTLVLPRRPDCPIATLATAGLPTIAIRVPAHRAMRALIAATRLPLAAPSANASGRVSPTRAAHVLHTLDGGIPLVIDDGGVTCGIESTIVMMTAGAPIILREGPVGAEALAGLLGRPVSRALPGSKPVAPGQLLDHYAPDKPLRVNAVAWRGNEYRIGFGDFGGDETLSSSGDLVEAAAHLFDALHRGDQSERASIAVAPIPAKGLGLAINDRLARATASQGAAAATG